MQNAWQAYLSIPDNATKWFLYLYKYITYIYINTFYDLHYTSEETDSDTE